MVNEYPDYYVLVMDNKDNVIKGFMQGGDFFYTVFFNIILKNILYFLLMKANHFSYLPLIVFILPKNNEF